MVGTEPRRIPLQVSSDYGWNWKLYAEQRVLVGTIGGPYTVEDGRAVYDLATTEAMAGFSERTGDLLWRDRGSAYGCGIAGIDLPVRCRSRGSLTYRSGSASFEGLDVTVEGFDLVTGKTTWSVAMGAAESLAYGDADPAIAGSTQLVVNRPEGAVILDYATGETQSAAPGATFWCMADAIYEFATMEYWHIEYERPGGRLAFICDGRGNPANVLPSAAATMAAGARVGNDAVLATRDGLLGFRAR